MSNTPKLRLPTLAEIAATRAAKETQAKVFLEETLPAALKAEILRYYCEEATRQVMGGADNIWVKPDYPAWRKALFEQLGDQFAALQYVWELPSFDPFDHVFTKIGREIPDWMQTIPGFEDYEIDHRRILKSKS